MAPTLSPYPVQAMSTLQAWLGCQGLPFIHEDKWLQDLCLVAYGAYILTFSSFSCNVWLEVGMWAQRYPLDENLCVIYLLGHLGLKGSLWIT